MIKDIIKNQNNIFKIKSYSNQLNIFSENISFLDECYSFLKNDVKIVKNKYEFSEMFLNKTKHYYGMLKSAKRKPSINSLYLLIENLKLFQNDKSNTLIDKGKEILKKRLLKYI